MPCFHPISAFQRADGSITFAERGDLLRSLTLRCGQCIGCRLERARQWAVRIEHEASLNEFNSYLTLTYDEGHLPEYGSLRYRDFQLFMKRVRARLRVRTRYFVCGEYGSNLERPHFHAILFGVDWPDKTYWQKTAQGHKLYRSALLESLWPLGFSTIGAVTFESAGYVARYCMKKITGRAAPGHYARVDEDTGEVVQLMPEFCRMSLKPGIGRGWLERYTGDVYPEGKVLVNGFKSNAPRYYDKVFEGIDGVELEQLKFRREVAGEKHRGDQTPERLAVREKVTLAKTRQLKRSLDNGE